jgi:protein involved in polysaccharide export with SLBB domain
MIGKQLLAALVVGLMTLSSLVRPAAAGDYLLGADDRVRVTVYGWPELSGEHRIAIDGTISLPLAGEFDAAGNTIGDVRLAIADRLVAQLPSRPNVTLEITQYRPIYVLGAVSAPGAYEFQADMRVLQAIALAGGVRSVLQSGDNVAVQAANAQSDVDRINVEITGLRLREARLIAERDGAESFNAPDGLSSPLVDTMIAQERRLLTARREALAQNVDMLDGEKAHFEAEISALDAQLTQQLREIELLTELIGNQQSLVEGGLARRSELLDLQRQVALSEAGARGIVAAKARARQRMSELDRAIADQHAQRGIEIETSLQDVVTKLAQQHALLNAATRLTLANLDGTPVATGVHYRVKRTEGDELVETPADEASFLAPGDVLVVELSGPDEGAGPVAAPGSGN